MRKISLLTALFIYISVSYDVYAQVNSVTGASIAISDRVNTITTAVPFMTITPDARHGALGDAGAATSPDMYANYWNPAKLAFNPQELSFGMSYTPWLRNLVSDIDLSQVTGSYNIDNMSSIGVAFTYFSLGQIQFTDEFGNDIIQFRPNEWALQTNYARKLSDRLSGGIGLKFIYSNLTGGIDVLSAETRPGLAAAADISIYYENKDWQLGDNKATFAFGAVISNIGNKMSYSNIDQQDFLPMNLRLGPRLTLHLDDYNELSFHFDLNKLLVPTPPFYDGDTDSETFGQVVAGRDPNETSVAGAIFSSFYDAPGNPLTDEQGNFLRDENGMYQIEDGSRMREELREIYGGIGVEYWYDKLLAARVGYFAEHELKGNRKYMTFGIGLRYNVVGFDMSYLVPLYVGSQRTIVNSPLANTLRVTLSLDFANIGNRDN